MEFLLTHFCLNTQYRLGGSKFYNEYVNYFTLASLITMRTKVQGIAHEALALSLPPPSELSNNFDILTRIGTLKSHSFMHTPFSQPISSNFNAPHFLHPIDHKMNNLDPGYRVQHVKVHHHPKNQQSRRIHRILWKKLYRQRQLEIKMNQNWKLKFVETR